MVLGSADFERMDLLRAGQSDEPMLIGQFVF